MKRRAEIADEVYTTTISSRGQVVLPAQVRRKMSLRKGMRLHIVLSQDGRDRLILKPAAPRPLSRWRGAFPDAGAALDFLEQERKKDRDHGR